MVSDSRNRSTSARCSDAVHGEQRNEKARNGSVNESEGRWRARERGVVDLATLDGRKTGIALHDGTHSGFGRPPTPLLRTVPHRKKYGRGEGETDMWGPRVRFDFH